jgi:tetratricopeptide (TPR) repeat protein
MRLALSDLDVAVRDLDAAATLASDAWRPGPTEIAGIQRIAAMALIQSGRLDEAEARLERAVALLAGTDSPDLAPVLYLFAQLRWHQERFAEARSLAQRSLAEAERRGDRAAMAKGHEMMALACHPLGEWQDGQRHEHERQALADGTLDVDQAFDVHLCLWEYHLYGDRGSDGIRRVVEQTLDQARRMGAPRAIALCRAFGGTLDFQTGRWGVAEAQLREALLLYRQVGSACGESLSLQRLGTLLTAAGRLDEARTLLDEGIAVGGRAAMRSHCLTRLHASMTRNRLAAGDLASARTSLTEGLAEAARHGSCATCSSLLLPEAVRVAIAATDLDAAERHVTGLEQVASRYGSRAWTAMALQARGRLLGARGAPEAAIEALEEARRAYADAGSLYEAARCLSVQGVLASAAGEKTRARRFEKEARAAYEALGAAGIER